VKCPACEQYVFIDYPTECPGCHVKVHVCKPCFGTGTIEAWGSGSDHGTRRELIQCSECAGHGLIRTERATTT
jgi:hypothetical protein